MASSITFTQTYMDAKNAMKTARDIYWALETQVFDLGKEELMGELRVAGMAYEMAMADELKAFEIFNEASQAANQLVLESEPELLAAA